MSTFVQHCALFARLLVIFRVTHCRTPRFIDGCYVLSLPQFQLLPSRFFQRPPPREQKRKLNHNAIALIHAVGAVCPDAIFQFSGRTVVAVNSEFWVRFRIGRCLLCDRFHVNWPAAVTPNEQFGALLRAEVSRLSGASPSVQMQQMLDSLRRIFVIGQFLCVVQTMNHCAAESGFSITSAPGLAVGLQFAEGFSPYHRFRCYVRNGLIVLSSEWPLVTHESRDFFYYSFRHVSKVDLHSLLLEIQERLSRTKFSEFSDGIHKIFLKSPIKPIALRFTETGICSRSLAVCTVLGDFCCSLSLNFSIGTIEN
jgi:hypothetical protein